MADSRPRRLALYGLGFGLAALVVFGIGLLWGTELGLMGLGLVFLGLAIGAILGTLGLIVSATALRQAELRRDKNLAIAGLVVGLIPVVLLLLVVLDVRRGRSDPPELPVEPPPAELRQPEQALP